MRRNRGEKRPIILDGNIAIVELTKGYFAGIDVVDAEEVGKWNWYAHRTNGNFYAARTGDGHKIVYLHRLLCDSPNEVDHKNGETLDCRRSNLREANRFTNMRNTRAKGGSSRFKGVYRHSQNPSWIAQITVNRKCIHIGSFVTERLAAQAYDEAAKIHHGEFARLNAA